MAKTLNARIITKHDTEANWEKALSFIPKLGEIIIYETPLKTIPNEYDWTSIPRIKIGDGNTLINDLLFITEAYVQKRSGWDLSENNYNSTHWNIVNKIANLGYEPQYTDTTYQAGNGLSLNINSNTFYNTGVISIQPGDNNGTIKYRLGKENGNYEDIPITITGLADSAFTPSSNFLTSDELVKINKSITKLEPSGTPGSLKYTDALGETGFVAVPGLGKLAFKDGFDGDFIQVDEVVIQNTQPVDNIPIWIDCSNGGAGILKYYDNTNGYTKINLGVSSIDSLINNNSIYGFTAKAEEQTVDYTFGVLNLERSANNINELIVNINGTQKTLKVGQNFQFETGQSLGGFNVIIDGVAETILISGLGLNAFNSTEYLPLAGGTVTGVTVFSNTTTSTSTSTGAVKISGGLGVAKDIYGAKVHGSVYNDYAEYRQSIDHIEPGYIVYSDDEGILRKTKNRLQHFEGVVSDTFGFSIGKTDKAQTPLAVAGRVLVYTDEELHAGDVVCAGENGKASKMDNIEIANKPDRIVGIVSEIPTYDTWGEDNIPVNGRVWIRVK